MKRRTRTKTRRKKVEGRVGGSGGKVKHSKTASAFMTFQHSTSNSQVDVVVFLFVCLFDAIFQLLNPMSLAAFPDKKMEGGKKFEHS